VVPLTGKIGDKLTGLSVVVAAGVDACPPTRFDALASALEAVEVTCRESDDTSEVPACCALVFFCSADTERRVVDSDTLELVLEVDLPLDADLGLLDEFGSLD